MYIYKSKLIFQIMSATLHPTLAFSSPNDEMMKVIKTLKKCYFSGSITTFFKVNPEKCHFLSNNSEKTD